MPANQSDTPLVHDNHSAHRGNTLNAFCGAHQTTSKPWPSIVPCVALCDEVPSPWTPTSAASSPHPSLNPTDGRLGLILIGVVVVGAILLWRRGQKPKEEAIRFFQ